MSKQASYWVLFWVLACVGLAADQATKYYTFGWLREAPGHKQVVIPEVFDLIAQHERDDQGNIVPYVNRGALFGWMQHTGVKANTGFALVSFLAAFAIIFWIGPRSAHDRWMTVSLGLILGGTVGNLWDRLMFGGVRDFLHWKAPDWPVFNIADCCLVAGAGLLLVLAMRGNPTADENTPGTLHAVQTGEAARVASSSHS